MILHIAPPTIVVDADQRGGWTQIFGGTTSEWEKYGVVWNWKCNVYPSHLYLARSS